MLSFLLSSWFWLGLLTLGGLLGFTVFLSLFFRRVVSTNEVHIVQSRKLTTSYGKDTGHGNTYYEWPSWLPLIGITKMVLPVSVFDLDLLNYQAFDKGRLPFLVHIKAFFRIIDSNLSAQRVASFVELRDQLNAIVQGAVRTILANSEIEEIMASRSKFGEEFTKEVSEQLANWGVTAVKNIELMDICDAQGSTVIKNIMEKKKSHIEMESRQAVAKNHRDAEIAETTARKEVDLNKQEAAQAVGLRTLEANRQVEIAEQEMKQAIGEQQKLTKDKEMSVLKVQHVRTAEINKEVEMVKADQEKQTTVLRADGALAAQERQAKGIAVEGQARADAEKAMQLAPVEAQIVLAKEIGGNESYQKYLVTIRQLEATQAVGIEQAKALEKADVKIISNTGDPVSGINSVGDLFSTKGGLKIGSMLEGLAQTETGKNLLSVVDNKKGA